MASKNEMEGKEEKEWIGIFWSKEVTKKRKRGLKEKKEICWDRKKKGKTGMDVKDRNKDEDRK